jgi:O-methyltransferase
MRLRSRLAAVGLRIERRDDVRLFKKYQADTMIIMPKFIDNVALARTVRVQGIVVECGSWRGGMSAAIGEATGRKCVLLDSFEGIPDAGPEDGEGGKAAFAARGDRLEADESAAIAAMRRSGVPFETRRGFFESTVPALAAERPTIALLRLDGDWYDSTMICFEQLFKLVPDDGLVIIDDYGYVEGCTRATHDFLSREKREEPLQHSRYGVIYLVKGSGFAAMP